ncbi:hypothetical protein AGMMS49983_10810 [Clostridia bacterium]|nr:hypothetical protein AGMMS49983_10810 [Clostridia bacterium]
MMIPGTDDLIICTNDGEGASDLGGGAWLFKAKGFAEAYLTYQFR